MAYYEDLNDDTRNNVWACLWEKVKLSKEHKKIAKLSNMKFEDYIEEIVSDWINTHNWDLSDADWEEQAEEADI